MRRLLIGALALALGAAVTVVVAQDNETPDDSYPRTVVVTFRTDGHKACKDLEAKVAKVRAQFEDKDVLFVTADLTSRASRHQAKLLLNALSLGEIWRKNSKSPDRCVLVGADTGEVLKSLTSKDSEKDLTEAIKKSLQEDEDEGMEEDSDEGGSEKGCGG